MLSGDICPEAHHTCARCKYLGKAHSRPFDRWKPLPQFVPMFFARVAWQWFWLIPNPR